jgi:large subunit ribosomal protein L20
MARVKRGVTAHRRHKRLLNRAEGRRGTRSKLVRPAREALIHALVYAYRDRRDRKRDMRRLWIERINAASRQHGVPYGRFIAGLKGAGVEVNRKMLADMAVREPAAFAAMVETSKSSFTTRPANRRRRSLTAPPGFRGGVVPFPR